MKTYFNTHTFDEFIEKHNVFCTQSPQEADFLVLGAKKVDYSEFNGIKAVYRFGIGVDNVDFDFLKKKNIPVYFPGKDTKNILYDATANFTVYGILSSLYKDAFGDADIWKKKQRDYLGQKRALIVGTGNIGSKVVKKLQAFMNVNTYDISINKIEELKPLIDTADVISLHMPLNKDTENFFNKDKLSWTKDNVLFINTGRGALFNEDALYEKLNATDSRAFFDVFWQEPYKGKLKKLGQSKFFMTPHSASNTKQFISAGFKEILAIKERLENE